MEQRGDLVPEALKELNLGKNEIKVYLAVLANKKTNVAEIATKSSVHRVNVYDALGSLISKGMVTELKISNKTYYSASNPDTLSLILKQKEDKINQILPTLKNLYAHSENQAQVFEGLDGVKLILRDMIATGKKIEAFGIPKIMPELLKSFLITFHRDRIAKKIAIDHIYNESAKERIAYLNKLKYGRAKNLPPEYSVPATTVIYGSKIAFFVWSAEPFSVLIESQKMADAYRKYFQILWKLAI